MKNLLLFFVLCISVFPQQFSRLNGLEDPQGNTILLYSYGIDNSGRFSPVYKYNVDSEIETKIMDAYSNVIDTSYTNSKTIGDYEFFPSDVNNFINVGLIFDATTQGYAARNDTITYTDWGIFFVDISKQRPNQVYVSDFHKVIRSFDGGDTYPADSTIDFEFLSVADFDERVFFGTDNNRLIKSEDQGITSSVVDTSDIQTSMPGLEFYYDINQFHIYRLNRSNGKFTLNVSNNRGNAFSWTKTYESDTQIFITADSTQSGVLYLADGRRIYKSTNNGYTFNEYNSLPSKLVGIYKKPNSEIIYAASKNMIFKITPDSVLVIKSLPIPEDVFSFYPLSVGNYWVYNVFDWSYPYYSHYIYTRKVVSKEILSNSKEYFVIEETENNYPAIFTVFERVDSMNGKILRYEENCSTPDNEIIIEDFMAEVGDSILIGRFSHCSGILSLFEQEGTMDIFSQVKNYRNFRYDYLQSFGHRLVQGFGIHSISVSYDFGNTGYTLKGCIVNGIVYGDTTLTDVDDELNSLPTEYKLEQNYPNPFNPSTKISWQLPVSSWVTVKIFDALGREVETLVNEYQHAGNHSTLYIVNSTLPSGIYFYRLKAGDYVETKKMLLLK